MKRSKRRALAKETLQILDNEYYINNNNEKVELGHLQELAVEKTYLYRPEELAKLIAAPLNDNSSYNTLFEVNNLSSLDAVRKLSETEDKLICLNFASARNPGGGFLNGSQAQEESIARASALYPCQRKAKDYYTINRAFSSCLYTNHIIYSPNVPIFRLEDGTLMDQPCCCSIITAPAVNAGAVKRNEPKHIDKISSSMYQRMDMVLAICATRKYETLVLGAWGCGVFGNSPDEVSSLFHQLLNHKYRGAFRKVIFAIYAKEDRFRTPFEEKFG